MKQKLITLLLAVATLSAFAQSLPQMKDQYVTDAAGILSKSELKQLRTDVKSMCDYYSTRIVVGIVSTFDDYDIDEYAGELAEKWDLSDENTMLILVKPKSEEERGEALLLASSDLQDVFTSEVCDNIVHDQMIPHFKTDDYFGGIEAALEYMNNMSDEDGEEEEAAVVAPSDNKEKSGSGLWEGVKSFGGLVGLGALTILKWVLILGAIAALAGLVYWLINRKKEEEDEKPLRSNFSSKSDTEELSTAVADKKQEIEKRKRELEELKRLEREKQELEDECDNFQARSERRHQRDYEDYDYDDADEYDSGRASRNLEDVLGKLSQVSEGKGKSILGTVGKVAAGVAGAAVVGKIVKNRREKKGDDDGGLLNDIGSVFKKKEKDDSNAPSSKPKLGGSGKSNASGNKPKLGGGKSKPSGNSSSGGW